jgi:stringent starvation protein B
MHEWMVDCGYTPHLIVDALPEGVQVPREYVKDGRIVLNVSASATQALLIGPELLEFNARFGGTSRHIRVPITAVLGIYAKETGQGMVFNEETARQSATEEQATNTPAPAPRPDPPKRAKLKVVK